MIDGRASKILIVTLRWISFALVILAISCSFLVIFQAIFKPFNFVFSNSMSPQISKGDAIIIREVEPNQIEVGDVVVFIEHGKDMKILIHRVIGMEKRGSTGVLTTKGDSEPKADSQKTSSDEVLGKVALRIRGMGSFFSFLETGRGYVSLIVAPVGLALLLVFSLSLVEKVSISGIRKRIYRRPPPTGISNSL
ncbi:MAG: signal peptidase I [Actinomycetota bacterium]|nr:signal peptidase I [Actinomycetota bacterium]